MLKDEWEVRDYLIHSIEGLLGFWSDSWFNFTTVELVKIYLALSK